MSRLKPRPPGLRDAAQTVTAVTELISEYEDAASNTYNPGTTPGQAGSDSTGTLLYQHGDHLTTRVTTENSGALSNRQGHYPYGESWYEALTANPSVLRKYTKYLRDDETTSGKLNYAIYREHTSRTGRYLSTDPVHGRFNPQTLNRYAYVANEPAGRTDATGRQYTCLALGPFAGYWGGRELDSWDCYMYSYAGMSRTAIEVNGGGPGPRPGGSPCGTTLPFGDERNPVQCPVPRVPPPPGPSCFAQLKYRPVNDWRAGLIGATHSFWYVQDSAGRNRIVSGGPDPFMGVDYLMVWINNGIISGADNVSATTWWGSSVAPEHCTGVGNILFVADSFPRYYFRYDVLIQNSNTAARWLRDAGGFLDATQPPGAIGW